MMMDCRGQIGLGSQLETGELKAGCYRTAHQRKTVCIDKLCSEPATCGHHSLEHSTSMLYRISQEMGGQPAVCRGLQPDRTSPGRVAARQPSGAPARDGWAGRPLSQAGARRRRRSGVARAPK